MSTTEKYLNELENQRGALEENLIAVGVSISAGANFTELVPKVLESNAALIYLIDGTLTEMMIPDGVKVISKYAFYYRNFTAVSIPNSVSEIGYGAFSNCAKITSVIIPDSVITLGSYAFMNCKALNKLQISKAITRISDYAFSGCTSLATVVIPDSVKEIYPNAFDGCTALNEITIPKNVTSISAYAFWNCKGLKTITFKGVPNSVDSWAFRNCTQSDLTIYCPWSAGEVAGAPWGATNATIIYDYEG